MSLPRRARALAALLLCVNALEGFLLQAADRPANGPKIYRSQCAKCHGRAGEGVKGKYDEALHGDWSIEKLTRYIDKNMPEDAPEKCVGADAEAVARYINEAFYSREARARQHPPRIELARLTNRQYVNAVADLIRTFGSGEETASAGEHGLRAAYYRSRDFRRERRISERVDRGVDFDFRAAGPDGEPIGTNELSAHWRGSLLADESGDYEFIVKTANGVRLWVNDEDTPLIDAWVASGEGAEHKAILRLIGGRSYPLRLEYFRFREKSVSVSLQWKPPHGTLEPIPARSLSTARATPTFVLTTPFPPDDSSVGYERGVAVSKAWDEAATEAAIEVANHVVKHLDRLSGSRPRETNRTAKVQTFCEQFVAAAWRRPLTPEQKRVFVAGPCRTAPKIEDAVKRVVLLALKSPRFLYLGIDGTKPNDYDVAARLSFGLWDSLPNRAQLRRASEGALHTPEQVRMEAKRMLGDPRARAKMQYFLHQWLQMNHAEEIAKDTTLFPGFTPQVVADLRTSLNLFLDDVIWSRSSDYRRLLLEDDLFVNNRLAQFYGLSTNTTDDFVKVSLDPKQRSGVITHPYLLAAFSYPKSSSPIHRGVFLTRNIVGRALKPPPMAVTFKDADFAPNLTMREKVAELTRPQACQGCHSVINPLGFSLEHYDAVGRFRTREGDRSIDAASDYVTDEGTTVKLSGARDVAEFAAGSEHAQNAFIEQLFHQIVKQPLVAYGSQLPVRLRAFFVESGYNVQQLVVEIAAVSALHDVEKNPTPRKKS